MKHIFRSVNYYRYKNNITSKHNQHFCHVASLSWQEPEEELNKLLMKVSDRDRNVKSIGKTMLVVLWDNSIFVSLISLNWLT